MQLNPRYGDDPIITLDGPGASVLAPAARQRRRLAETLASFTADQWAHPTRCEGWTTREVIAHLDSTNSFWAFSITSGLAGEPTRFLTDFDPVTSPPALIASTAELATDDLLARFTASTVALVALLESIDEPGWQTLAEAPPGHLHISAVAHHALWDSWVHERDVLLPLGLPQEVHDDEVAACLRYAASLSPAFALTLAEQRIGRLAVQVAEPTLSFSVEVDGRAAVHDGAPDVADLVLRGDAVQLLEALSLRAPLEQPVPDDAAWLLRGLAVAFDADEGGPQPV